MPRALAIDFGTKRTGIAVSDSMQVFAFALETVSTKEVISYIKKYILSEPVSQFVLGDPIRLDGTPSETAPLVKQFKNTLKQTFPDIPICMIDERFTSTIAKQTILASGIGKKKRQDKTIADRISAVLILQSYLERIHK